MIKFQSKLSKSVVKIIENNQSSSKSKMIYFYFESKRKLLNFYNLGQRIFRDPRITCLNRGFVYHQTFHICEKTFPPLVISFHFLLQNLQFRCFCNKIIMSFQFIQIWMTICRAIRDLLPLRPSETLCNSPDSFLSSAKKFAWFLTRGISWSLKHEQS